jgi:L-amino acid N-acyltransferase YncA
MEVLTGCFHRPFGKLRAGAGRRGAENGKGENRRKRIMNSIQFGELKDADIRAVLEIYNYYVLNTTVTFHSHALTESEMRKIVFFDLPKYRTFAIWDENGICGYVILTRFKEREAYDGTAEVTVYLKQGFTGKGIGTLALRYIEGYAKTRDIHVLIASIAGNNEASIRLFLKNGYTECAHYREVGMKFGKLLDVVACQKIIS